MSKLRGGLVGCGFFAANHLHGWREVDGADIVAVCDLDPIRARKMAETFDIPSVYTDVAQMLTGEALDFVDIVTQPVSHRALVELAAQHRVPVICQKPQAPTMDDAHAMVRACREADIPFMVHENFRWQAPIRAVKEAARSIGNLFFGRISFRSGYDVYADQPNLATDERFIIYDLGVHLLDLARFFFGEVIQLTGRMQRVNPNIRAEDVATILLTTESGAVCIVDMSYASKLEDELFPQTLVHLEGTTGSVLMGPHFALTTTNASGTTHRLVPPHSYDWTVPPTEVVQSSVVSIQQHWVDCLRGGRQPDTSGTDNLRTLALVFAAYASAESGLPVKPTDF